MTLLTGRLWRCGLAIQQLAASRRRRSEDVVKSSKPWPGPLGVVFICPWEWIMTSTGVTVPAAAE